MAVVPAILVFGIMVWFATRKDGSSDPQAGMPDYSVELCYEIEGFEYQVYEILKPDGSSHTEGGDDYFFIGTSADMSSIVQGATGPSSYNTKQKAINALTSMYESMNPDDPDGPVRGSTTVQGGTEYETVEGGGSKAKKADLAKEQDKIIVAEGREESAVIEDLDVEIYDGEGSLVETYNVEERAGTVETQTNLGGSL